MALTLVARKDVLRVPQRVTHAAHADGAPPCHSPFTVLFFISNLCSVLCNEGLLEVIRHKLIACKLGRERRASSREAAERY